MKILHDLNPSSVFKYFEDICNIPHGSYNTKGLSDYCVDFAIEHNLEYVQDSLNNVIIYKQGSTGYEDAPILMIQGHLDMVCEKNEDVQHDFLNQPIELYIEDGFVRGRGTTLGGDDGIAIAYALALLENNKIVHPPLEIIFTTEEEVGMEGALGLDESKLSGKHLINIDSEEENVFTVSCAGGTTISANVMGNTTSIEGDLYSIKITGLYGGHSGVDIHKPRENANKLLSLYLSALKEELELYIIHISGGLKNNAIPREASVALVIPSGHIEEFKEIVDKVTQDISNRIIKDEPDFETNIQYCENEISTCFDRDTTDSVINFISTMPNGVISMSQECEDMVETSLNLGVMKTEEDHISFEISLRSSVTQALENLKETVFTICKENSVDYKVHSVYPGWAYKKDSFLRELMTTVHMNVYNKPPIIESIHAGLECGILASKIEDIDIVSIGPDIYDIHTPNERLSIASVSRTWDFLVQVIENFAKYSRK